MDSEERRRFSGKVYARRNGKTPKKDASTAMASADVTRVSETLDGEQPVKVVPKTDHLITNSGDVSEGGVELKEDGNCSGEEVVRISLNESKSAEIRNVRSRLEGELDDVRRMVKKVEVKETSLHNANNKCRLVLIPHPPKISCRYPQFTSYMINRPPSPNYHPAVCGIVESEKRIPKANQCYNPPVCGIVEREKRIPKILIVTVLLDEDRMQDLGCERIFDEICVASELQV
ncbi:hypothetical protein KY289_005023 [Solanum tuberosum]|nr:hypothetical protein KY289_005023 [Solanum tuberosum]